MSGQILSKNKKAPVIPPHEPDLPTSPGQPSKRLTVADALRARAAPVQRAEGDPVVPGRRPVPEAEPKSDELQESPAPIDPVTQPQIDLKPTPPSPEREPKSDGLRESLN